MSRSALSVACPSCKKAGTVAVEYGGAIVSQFTWAVACSLCKKTFTVAIHVEALPRTDKDESL